jgi:CheY-like chemotaxis protein
MSLRRNAWWWRLFDAAFDTARATDADYERRRAGVSITHFSKGREAATFSIGDFSLSLYHKRRNFNSTVRVNSPMPARILIVDDYTDNRELLRLILEPGGHTIREACDGRECVEAARAEAFDLIIIDLSMPILDGFATLCELRADPRTRDIPCVAFTASAAREDQQRALDAGFDAYLSKPFYVKDLLELVGRLLKAQAARHKLIEQAND